MLFRSQRRAGNRDGLGCPRQHCVDPPIPAGAVLFFLFDEYSTNVPSDHRCERLGLRLLRSLPKVGCRLALRATAPPLTLANRYHQCRRHRYLSRPASLQSRHLRTSFPLLDLAALTSSFAGLRTRSLDDSRRHCHLRPLRHHARRRSRANKGLSQEWCVDDSPADVDSQRSSTRIWVDDQGAFASGRARRCSFATSALDRSCSPALSNRG